MNRGGNPMTEFERLIKQDPDFSSLETVLVALIERGDPEQPDFGLAAIGVDVPTLEQSDWVLLVKLALSEFGRRSIAGTPPLTPHQRDLMKVFAAMLPHLAQGWPLWLASRVARH